MYAPSYSPKARHYFYKCIRHKWFRLHNVIVMGDFNNVEDETRGRLRPSPSHHTDDITTFFEFRTSHRLLDAYIEQYELDEDEPVMMTNHTNIQNGLTSHSRIDRAYYSQQLHGIVWFDDQDNIPSCAVSTQGHSPIAITLLDPKISRVHHYKKIWGMGADSLNDTILLHCTWEQQPDITRYIQNTCINTGHIWYLNRTVTTAIKSYHHTSMNSLSVDSCLKLGLSLTQS